MSHQQAWTQGPRIVASHVNHKANVVSRVVHVADAGSVVAVRMLCWKRYIKAPEQSQLSSRPICGQRKRGAGAEGGNWGWSRRRAALETGGYLTTNTEYRIQGRFGTWSWPSRSSVMRSRKDMSGLGEFSPDSGGEAAPGPEPASG
jgi:hypothetical protein